jgi:hypothetical protein
MGSIFGVDAHLGPLAVNGGPPNEAAVCSKPGRRRSSRLWPESRSRQRGVAACVNGKMDMGAVERQSPEVIIFRDGFESG